MARARSPGREHAFTLVEILVVTAIAAIVIGLAAVRLEPSDARRLDGVADALLRQLETARDEAVVRGRALAFSSDGQGYQYWMAEPGKRGWIPLTEPGSLAPGQWAAPVRLQAIRVNDSERPLGEKLVFSISGFSEAFRLTLVAGDATQDITGDALGRMTKGRAP